VASKSFLRLPSRFLPNRPARCALVAAALSLAGVTGCATGEILMQAQIAGGQTVQVPMGRGGVAMTNEDDVQINVATFLLNPEKKIAYAFGFTDNRKRALRNVRVEDVTDTAPAILVDDAAPKLSDKGEWRGEVASLDFSDPRLGWLATISNTLCVYRFTLTFADGHTLVLHQGAFYPAAIKSAARVAGGQKY
jgi:hypothetical protein